MDVPGDHGHVHRCTGEAPDQQDARGYESGQGQQGHAPASLDFVDDLGALARPSTGAGRPLRPAGS